MKRRVLIVMLSAMFLTSCDDAYSVARKIKAQLRSFIHSGKADKPAMPEIVIPMVSGVKTIKDFAYGEHEKQRMDIFAPENASGAPIIMMLHGGGWTTGDKNGSVTYINKLNRWVPKGFIVTSVDTRLMPDADVYEQIEDLAQAVATTQKHAKEWGGDASKIILMGHSSAGTMVSVLAAKPSLVTKLGGQRWLASFALDSSSLDIPRTMRLWFPRMYTYAYGKDADKWAAASPINLLSSESIPMFIACSTKRPDNSCEQAKLFVEQADKFNIKTKIVPQDYDHGGVNFHLGKDEEYTKQAEEFMASLDAEVARRLGLD